MTPRLCIYITAAGGNSVDLNEDETLSFREGDLMGWYGKILMIDFCLIITENSEIFARVLFSRSFVKIRSLQNCEISLSFTDIGKSCLSREFLTSQKCLSMLFAKIKFSRKYPNNYVVQNVLFFLLMFNMV